MKIFKTFKENPKKFKSWLKSLSHKEKRRIAEMLLMKKNKDNEWKILKYNNPENISKIHHKQVAFHKAIAKTRLFLGGNRTGKTVSGAAESIFHATLKYPEWWEGRKFTKKTNGLVVSLDNNTQLEITQPAIVDWLPKSVIKYILGDHKSKITYADFKDCIKLATLILLKNGSKIRFKNCEAGRGKFQGTSKDWIWLDEEPPQDIYNECKARTVDSGGILYITMTPLKGFTWAYKEIHKNNVPGLTWSIVSNIADNPWQDPKEIDIFIRTCSEKDNRMRVKGEFCAVGGLVFDEFDREKHVIDYFDPDNDFTFFMGLDFGTRHETAVVYIGIDYDENIYIFDEYYEAEQDFDTHAEKIKEKMGKKIFRRRIMDSAATQAILEFNRRKLRLSPVQKLKGFKETARSIVKSKLKNKKMFIASTCINTIFEFEHYRYKEEKDDTDDNENIVKKQDHLMDALMYILFMLKHAKTEPKPKKMSARREAHELKKKERNERRED